MPGSASSLTPASTPTSIYRDPIFGFYALVTPGQTAALKIHFEEYEIDINCPEAKRLRRDDTNDLVIFCHKDAGKLLRKLNVADDLKGKFELAPDAAPAPAPTTEPHAGFHYAPPVFQLITLGDPDHYAGEMPSDYYAQRGITAADAPELARMYQDPELLHMEQHGNYSPSCWARSHALRALVEFHAPGTAQLMLDDLRTSILPEQDDDFYSAPNIEDTIALLPKLGDAAGDAVIAELRARSSENLDYAIRLTDIIRDLVEQHPHLRDTCRDAICAELENHPVNERDYNGFLVSTLIDFKAVEAAPLIEQAYAGGNTAIQICGDWEDVQIALDLKTKRDTPESVRINAIRAERGQLPLVDETPFRNSSPKIGRNDPCPCGSGKKYKKCCMDKTA